MKKLDLKTAADEFEMMIDNETHLFYNKQTGKFDFYNDYIMGDCDVDKFEGAAWVAAPNQRDLNEYNIMVDFADNVNDPRKNELLFVALQGRGAFRRFKDTLYSVDLLDEWCAFKHTAFVEIARRWCEENGIEYIDTEKKQQPDLPESPENTFSDDLEFVILPFSPRIVEDAIKVLRDTLGFSKTSAKEEIQRMLKKNRIALAAIAKNTENGSLFLAGIVGAIPQYGDTGWELHLIAVHKACQKRGVGTALIDALEEEVARCGGKMIYLSYGDESGATSLFGADLYEDTFGKLANIKNIGNHPYAFFEKSGYKIVGVLPDANGRGKPDIIMAKRLRRKG